MKKTILIFNLFCVFLSINAQIKENLQIPKNAKIGLSLAGGGAKGFAHIGTLKLIDSLGIKIDYISGTSMGAIVGGLYAAGYTGKDIEKIVKETDFYSIITNQKNRRESSFFNKNNDKYLLNIPFQNGKFNPIPKAISRGQKNLYMLKELLNKVSNITDFSELSIPFMAVATNLESGNLTIFDKGDLVNSIMASSAYPSLMDPIKIGDSLYIDGAMTVNYPSKPLKDKGMDIVIGVDLSLPLSKRDELNSAFSILDQIIDYNIKNETKNQYQYTDINIHPNLNGYSSTSYNEKENILKIGYEEALKYIPILEQLPKRESKSRATYNPIYSNVYKIDSISLENSKIFNKSYVTGKMNLKIPSLQTYGNINRMIDRLYATKNYNFINYDILQENGINILKLNLEEDNTRFFIKFGLHYDEVFKTGLLMNSTIKRLFFRNSTLSFDFIVGGNTPRYYFNYFVDNGYIPGFGIYSSGINFEIKDNSGNVTERWKWIHNELFIQSIWKDKFAIGGGLSHDYNESKIGSNTYDDEQFFVNPYLFIKSDTRNDKDFPTKGFYLNADGKIIDFFGTKHENQTLQIKGNIQFNIPISQRFTYRLNLFGGFTVGEYIPKYYQFLSGGIFEQNFGNFIPFQGYQFGSSKANNLVIANSDFQFRIQKNYFLTTHFNIINNFNEHQLKYIIRIADFSGGITLGYKSPFGQIKLNYSRAYDRNKGVLSVVMGHWF